eukprot:SAG31_NODE_58_length_29669_cov_20.244978_27_plen_182_part_00
MAFVRSAVVTLEDSQPEVVLKMSAMAAVLYPIDDAGRVVRAGEAAAAAEARGMQETNTTWTPHSTATLTQVFENHLRDAPSAAACQISLFDFFLSMGKPFTQESPLAILGVISAEPTGAIAQSWRGWIRTVFVPMLKRVVDILEKHSAAIEWPDSGWLVRSSPRTEVHLGIMFFFLCIHAP